MFVGVQGQRHSKLAEVILADSPFPPFFRLIERGQKQCRQEPNHCDDNKQFDEGERLCSPRLLATSPQP
jgi:hypothetical protein